MVFDLLFTEIKFDGRTIITYFALHNNNTKKKKNWYDLLKYDVNDAIIKNTSKRTSILLIIIQEREKLQPLGTIIIMAKEERNIESWLGNWTKSIYF